MRVPAVMPADRLHPVIAPAIPSLPILASTLQGLLQSTRISDVHQPAVVASGLDVPRTTVIGGDHRQTGGRSLQQGEPERLRERWIDKQPAPFSSPSIEGGHLRASMLFGVSDSPVEVITINQIEDLLKNVPLLLLELAGIITTSQHQDQVVTVTQHR